MNNYYEKAMLDLLDLSHLEGLTMEFEVTTTSMSQELKPLIEQFSEKLFEGYEEKKEEIVESVLRTANRKYNHWERIERNVEKLAGNKFYDWEILAIKRFALEIWYSFELKSVFYDKVQEKIEELLKKELNNYIMEQVKPFLRLYSIEQFSVLLTDYNFKKITTELVSYFSEALYREEIARNAVEYGIEKISKVAFKKAVKMLRQGYFFDWSVLRHHQTHWNNKLENGVVKSRRIRELDEIIRNLK